MDLSQLYILQFTMFAEMLIGYLLCRFHVLKPSDRSVLSKLVIYVLLPFNIINSFKMEMNSDIMMKFLQIFIVSCLIQVFCALIARSAFNRVMPERKKIMQYATVCSNAGFLGNAVAEGVYGSLGMMYGQIYLIPQRIVMWSAGVSYFESGGDLKTVVKKILTHPCIIAVGIGLLRLILQIPFPTYVDALLSTVGRCTTPVIVIFLGMILAEAGFSGLLEKDNIIFAVIRLLIIPLIVLAGCKIAHVDPMITGLSVLLAAMPAGSTTAILAEQYHADVAFAANCIVLTTILSIAVLPVWVMFLNAF